MTSHFLFLWQHHFLGSMCKTISQKQSKGRVTGQRFSASKGLNSPEYVIVQMVWKTHEDSDYITMTTIIH